MPANHNVRTFLTTVCDKKGFRFAVKLHNALREGRPEARSMLREALRAVRN